MLVPKARLRIRMLGSSLESVSAEPSGLQLTMLLVSSLRTMTSAADVWGNARGMAAEVVPSRVGGSVDVPGVVNAFRRNLMEWPDSMVAFADEEQNFGKPSLEKGLLLSRAAVVCCRGTASDGGWRGTRSSNTLSRPAGGGSSGVPATEHFRKCDFYWGLELLFMTTGSISLIAGPLQGPVTLRLHDPGFS